MYVCFFSSQLIDNKNFFENFICNEYICSKYILKNFRKRTDKFFQEKII